jgi:hypothetical protein
MASVAPCAAVAGDTAAGAVRTEVGDGGTAVVTTGDAEDVDGLVAVDVAGVVADVVGAEGAGVVVVGAGAAAVTFTTENPDTPFPVTWPGLESPTKPYSGDPS